MEDDAVTSRSRVRRRTKRSSRRSWTRRRTTKRISSKKISTKSSREAVESTPTREIGRRRPSAPRVGGDAFAAAALGFAAALFALHALVAACAVRLRSLQLALDVVGATFGSLVAFVLPGALFIAAFDPARGRDGADGLAWAAKTITAEDGRRVTVPRMRYRVLAWTLVAVGGMTSACGVAATAKELATTR